MAHPIPPPDEAVLRRFLLGDLPPDELAAVGELLDAHPELASTLNALRVEDTLLAALRHAPADDPLDPAVAAVMGHVSGLSGGPPGGATVTAGPDFDPGPGGEPDPVAELVAAFDPPDRPGDLGRLGGFRVVRVLGRGGMGAVFEAEDPRLGRRVALKAMLPGLAASPRARQRFLREAATAAKVEHDFIVPIYLIGEDRGVPFLAMPLLHGEGLDGRLRDGRPLPVDQALRVGREVAEGLAAAHAAGLIHRDIKPSNVWLEAAPGGAFRRVRLLDFGLAKAVAGAADADDLTHPGAVLGTPAYMAPEQARGRPVDARADLFSLGAVLYQMATGRRPFTGPDPFAVLTALATDTPPPADAVNPAVPPALAALIGWLLAKDPAGRPGSARAVADELARIAADPAAAPVTYARPPDTKVILTAVGGDETQALTRPRPARQAGGRWPGVAAGLLLGVMAAVGAYNGKTVVRVLTDRGELVVEVDDPAIEVTVKRGEAVVVDATKGRTFVLTAGDGEVLFRDPESGATAVTRAFRIERGGRAVVTATAAEVAAKPAPEPAAEVARAAAEGPPAGPVPTNGPPNDPWVEARRRVGWLAVSPDGATLAVPVEAGNDVWLIDTATGHVRHVLSGHAGMVYRPAFSPDGRLLVTPSWDRTARVWEVATGRAVRALPHPGVALAAAFRADGGRLAVAGTSTLRVWRTEAGPDEWAEHHARGLDGHAHGVAFSPAGNLLATAAHTDRTAAADVTVTVQLWDAADGHVVHAFDPLPGESGGVAFSPDGKLLAAGSSGAVGVWEVTGRKPKFVDTARTGQWVTFGPDGKSLWSGPWDSAPGGKPARPYRWDVAAGTPAELAVPPLAVWTTFALTRDARTLYVADGRDGIWVCDPVTGRVRPGPPRPPPPAVPRPLARVVKNDGWIAVSPDGKWLAVPRGGAGPDVQVLDAATGAVRHTLTTGGPHRAMRAAFTPDGRRLVTANTAGKDATVWDLEAGRPALDLPLGESAVAVAVRPDGKQAAVGGQTAVRVFDLTTGAVVRTLAVPAGGDVHGLAYSPAGDLLAAAAQTGAVRVWGADSGAVVRAFDGLPGRPMGVAFSPDGSRLAVGSPRGVRAWEIGSGKEMLARDGPSAAWVGFGPGGQFWTGPWGTADDKNPRLRRWDPAAGTPTDLDAPPLAGWASFALAADGATLYVADGRDAVWACDPLTGRPKPPAGPPPLTPPQRASLEWVLAAGGGLTVVADGREIRLNKGDRLPAGPFAVHDVNLYDAAGVDDAALDRLRDLPRVVGALDVSDRPITDAGLAKLAAVPGLADLVLINLNRTQVTGAGLVHLKAFPRLYRVGLSHTAAGGPGMKHLAALPGLTDLHMAECRFGPDDLAHLKGSNLRELLVFGSAGLGDGTADHLAAIPTLRTVDVSGTGVTEAGAKKLAAALPKCRVTWNDGVIDPPPDR